jgi:pyruvate kinase
MIEKLFLSGADVFRLNFSHGSQEEKLDLLKTIRSIEEKYSHPIAVLGDLQGPKLRVGEFSDPKGVYLEKDQRFVLDLNDAKGDNHRVKLPHPEIIAASEVGHILLIDDGKMKLTVVEKGDGWLGCNVDVPGQIKDRKGVNTPDSVLEISPLTPKDRSDLNYMLKIGVDWVALSFVQRASDVVEINELIDENLPKGMPRPSVMAKIEKVRGGRVSSLTTLPRSSCIHNVSNKCTKRDRPLISPPASSATSSLTLLSSARASW